MSKLSIYQAKTGEFTFLPYHLPEGRKGRCAVTRTVRKKGDRLTVVSMRSALFMGLKPSTVVLGCDVIVHDLIEMNDKQEVKANWMSTNPCEIEQHQRQLARAHGHVLVGGLGLGLAVSILSENPNVKSIVVVERNKDIIKLVWPHLNKAKAWPVCAELFGYLKTLNKRLRSFDFAFYDIWCPTGEAAFNRFVKPLRKLSIGLVPQSEIECWNEEEMLGQIRLSLTSRIQIETAPADSEFAKLKQSTLSDAAFNDPVNRKGNADTWPFLNWIRKHKPTLAVMNNELEDYMAALKDAERWEVRWQRYECI